MDLFVQSILICALIVNLIATSFFIYKVFRIEEMLVKFDRDFHAEMDCWQENLGCTDDKIDSVADEMTELLTKLTDIIKKIDKVAMNSIESFAALKESPEVTKPTKPNNWDSMKKAFVGPSRVEPDVRN